MAAGADSRARWRAVYDEVRPRHVAGEPLLAIGRRTGLARGTVRKFARAESFPERAVRAPGPSILDPYHAHLEARLAAGCENAMALWRELRSLGYAGTHRQVHRWLGRRRTAPARNTPRRWRDAGTAPAQSGEGTAARALPSPKQLAWLLTRPAAELTGGERAAVARVEQDREAASVAALVGRFADLVRGSGIGRRKARRAPLAAFKCWLSDALRSGVRAVATFAAGLQQDNAAVRAALTKPWSSGQAEGQISKLKLIKRQTYGRADFDLLRRRVLLAA